MPDAESPRGANLAQPWTKSYEEVLNVLESQVNDGLSKEEAQRRLRQYGPNRLRQKRQTPTWRILVNQFMNLIVGMLAAAAALSFVFGQWLEAVAICIALAVNVLIGFFTELKALRSMESLQQLSRVEATVVRGGGSMAVASEDLVPGDVVRLDGGDVLPADMRVVESARLQVDEAALTGESMPVDKVEEPVDQNAPLAERASMLYKGTAVTGGTGAGVVTATGMSTELGRVSELAEAAQSETSPLEKRLDRLGRKLGVATLVIAALLAVVGVIAGKEWLLILETSIALAVAAIPEGLPIVATIALARGMWNMANRNVLVNRLSAVETLGSTSVICTDKTGTLTENRMTVTRLILPAKDGRPQPMDLRDAGAELEPAEELLRIGALCSNAELNGDEGVGDPMEVALLRAASRAGIARDEALEAAPELSEEAFDSETKMMATYHQDGEGVLVAVKGAPEAVLQACTVVAGTDSARMGDELRQAWRSANTQLASQGLRVLAAAHKQPAGEGEAPYEGLTFLGLYGLMDPPREGVDKAIEECHRAGIRVVMVTGDQPSTAQQIAVDLNMAEEDEEALHGRELDELDPEAPGDREAILDTPVFSRVTPEQKLELIALLQKGGKVVAMTGDGVNDAPALKKADIGIAMGRRGTQVAQDAADMVLQDDTFSSIVQAVAQGRAIFNNIRKFILFLLSGNVAEILVVAVALLMGWALPLLPLQILYLNMLSDVFPALALGVGQGAPGLMEQPPRPSHQGLLTRQHWRAVIIYAVIIAVATLGAFWWAQAKMGLEGNAAVTISFLTLAFSRQWHVVNMRERSSGYLVNEVTRNKWVWAAVMLCFALLFVAVYTPPLALALSMTPPSAEGWTAIVGFSLVPLVMGQALKALRVLP